MYPVTLTRIDMQKCEQFKLKIAIIILLPVRVEFNNKISKVVVGKEGAIPWDTDPDLSPCLLLCDKRNNVFRVCIDRKC